VPASLRRAAALLVPALLIPALAACGSSKAGYGDPTSSGFDAATVGGDFGKTPTLKWNSQLSYPDSTQTKTLVQGGGAAVPTDQSVDLHIYIADASDDLQTAQQSCRSTPSAAGSGSAAASGAAQSVGQSAGATNVPSVAPSATDSASATTSPVTLQPCASNVSFPLDGKWAYQTKPGGYDSFNASKAGAVWQQILKGAKVGSRIEAVSNSEDVFPPQQQGYPAGNPELGIANHDPLLMVVDVMRLSPQAPKPTDRKAHDVSPSAFPKLVTKGGTPSGFDWSGFKKPALTEPLQRAYLKKGTGPVVKKTDTVTVNYLGEVYQAKKYFDESYFPKSKGATAKPLTTPLSGVVEGWTTGLTGVPVGSRVLLQIPPDMGYGAQGSPSGGIPGNATLWFVVDVLKAKSGS